MAAGSPSTWVEINLSALKNNIRLLQSMTGRPVMPVIKANAYGHGMVEVARAAEQAGSSWLGVARIEEAILLRQNGIDLPLLVLGFCLPDRVPEALHHKISLAVHHPDQAQAFGEQASAFGKSLNVHAKIDSGMGRLGVFAEQGLDFVRGIVKCRGLHLEGLFTHLARADEPGQDTTGWQIERFDQLLQAVEGLGLRPALVHAANSAGSLYFPGSRYDLVRPGIAVYGLRPNHDIPLPAGFRPVLTWKARLASVKDLPEGHGVSYNYRYITSHRERIGVIPVGYADGFRRTPGNVVLVGGARAPVVGAVCMDQCMIQLDGIPLAKIGDEVIIIGQQGNEIITAEELGSAWGTIDYEVVCGIAARVPRIFIDRD